MLFVVANSVVGQSGRMQSDPVSCVMGHGRDRRMKFWDECIEKVYLIAYFYFSNKMGEKILDVEEYYF